MYTHTHKAMALPPPPIVNLETTSLFYRIQFDQIFSPPPVNYPIYRVEKVIGINKKIKLERAFRDVVSQLF